MSEAVSRNLPKALKEEIQNILKNNLTPQNYALWQDSEAETVALRNTLVKLCDIYFSVHVIDLEEDSWIEIKSASEIKSLIDKKGNAKEQLQKVLAAATTDAQRAAVLEFVDLNTLVDRLKNKNSVSIDFIGTFHMCWTRATFIVKERNAEGEAKEVFFKTLDIQQMREREELLLNLAHIDELTGLGNRLALKEMINNIGCESLNKDLVLTTVDVNGLKKVNDTLGHDVGDELLCGAAWCLEQAYGDLGRCFRMGGDEFVVVACLSEEQQIAAEKKLKEFIEEWRGKLLSSLNISFGSAAARDFPEYSFYELRKLADTRMYIAKREYYQQLGIDRRSK